ncbi:signal recognition particle, alpha subunit, N-terminal-domain-containing protein [Tricharina praecox]|uniref:signal recognition particle, alpha subunit, N-terminal-domain-containing protein n=1 Tax=Tricharina praecox TaxID=43433 RepID=UPI00221ED2E7|nr:signal recognition particle, alpha subunit, N-terminal-domain-containing protein [Tricharina praecox]KAI5852282.1 signal recognition particle, alpha subunit, N-terminal-domain-containing protein [Tricharina praecox]
MAEEVGARSALDSFEILTTSGILLWSKKYAPVNSSVVNSFISDVLIEERAQPGSDGKWYKKDSYTLKWTTANDLGLIFIAVYQSLLQLTWIDELLDTVKTLFTSLYGDQLKKPHTSTIECHFDDYFNTRVHDLEKKYGAVTRPVVAAAPAPSESPALQDKWDAPPPIPGSMRTPLRPGSPAVSGSLLVPGTSDSSRPSSPGMGASGLITAKRPRGGRGRRGKSAGVASSGDELSPAPSSGKKSGKKGRVWDADGNADEADERVLDYSAQDASGEESVVARKLDYIDQKEWGKKTSKGEFVLKELGEEVEAILKQSDEKQSAGSGAMGGAFGFFKNFVGGKVLTREDMDKALGGMREHLLKKNIAQEAVNDIVKNVETSLLGQKTGTFQSIEAIVRSSVEAAIKRILTPTNSLDLLREIQHKKSRGARPYVISIVGVNGVGKSTNLSKICFFLLQNKYKVLIAACDTFRSGAVEQLRVHVRNLGELSAREGGVVELYEKGYGKDAANIAKDAVDYAEREKFDVVLIDTAGRRHNDQRLMSSLEKFAKFAVPDKILMVGEALVGTDSVMQARNFNAAFGSGRTLDGFIISKCDTVGDMIGTLISMVYATGIPVVFLGVGQNYQDLRTLNISWAVGLLMS